MTNEELLYQRVLEISREMGVEIKFKDESKFMKALSIPLLVINRKFMTHFTTAIGKSVYYPTREWLSSDYVRAAKILSHELIHVHDSKMLGSMRFSLSYLLPQILSLAAFFALSGNLWWLICLVFALPVPSYERTLSESRGYAVTRLVTRWLTGKNPSDEWLIGNFVGPNYYFMWPFRDDIIRLIEEQEKHLMKIERPSFKLLVQIQSACISYNEERK